METNNKNTIEDRIEEWTYFTDLIYIFLIAISIIVVFIGGLIENIAILFIANVMLLLLLLILLSTFPENETE